MAALGTLFAILFAVSVSFGGADYAAHTIKQGAGLSAADCHTSTEARETDSDGASFPSHDCQQCISCFGTQTFFRDQSYSISPHRPIELQVNFSDRTLHFFDPEFFLLRPPIELV